MRDVVAAVVVRAAAAHEATCTGKTFFDRSRCRSDSCKEATAVAASASCAAGRDGALLCGKNACVVTCLDPDDEAALPTPPETAQAGRGAETTARATIVASPLFRPRRLERATTAWPREESEPLCEGAVTAVVNAEFAGVTTAVLARPPIPTHREEKTTRREKNEERNKRKKDEIETRRERRERTQRHDTSQDEKDSGTPPPEVGAKLLFCPCWCVCFEQQQQLVYRRRADGRKSASRAAASCATAVAVAEQRRQGQVGRPLLGPERQLLLALRLAICMAAAAKAGRQVGSPKSSWQIGASNWCACVVVVGPIACLYELVVWQANCARLLVVRASSCREL